MTNPEQPNREAGVPTAVSADDHGQVGSAAQRDGHYVEAKDQVVKVVHQVTPAILPNQGPVEFGVPGRQGPTQADVKITPQGPSVWEALPEPGETPS